jgi:hypothetical protein
MKQTEEISKNEVKLSIPKSPTSVGGYRFGSNENYYTQFNFTYKPKWFHRTMMRIFFDMHWFNN